MRYWIYKDSQIIGPYAQEELSGLEGLCPDTLVCREDAAAQGDSWTALEAVAELAELCLVLTTASAGSLTASAAPRGEGLGGESLGLAPYWDRFLSSPKEKSVARAGRPDFRVRELTAQIEGLLARIGELENQQDQLLAQLGEKRRKESELVPQLAEKDRLVGTLHAKVQEFENQQGELLRQLADKQRTHAQVEGLVKRFEELESQKRQWLSPSLPPEPAAPTPPAVPEPEIKVLRKTIAPKSWPKAVAEPAAEMAAAQIPAVKVASPKKFTRAESVAEVEIISDWTPPIPAAPEPPPAPKKEEETIKASFSADAAPAEPEIPVFSQEPPPRMPPSMPSFDEAMSPAGEPPAVSAPPPMTMNFSPPPLPAAPILAAPEPSPADLSVDTDEVISRLAKHSGATQPTAPKPKRPQSKAFVVIIAVSSLGLLGAGFLFFRNTKEIKMMFNMGAGQGAIGTEVEETAEGALEKPRPAQPPDPALDPSAPGPEAAAAPKAQAISDPIPLAIELVKNYPLDGERASVGQWLQYSFAANPGNASKETWDAGAVDATTYLVRYTVVPGGSGSSAGEPITYLFEADLARKTVLGKNPAARALLSGAPPKAKKPARPAKRRAAVPPKKAEVPLLPLPTEAELLPPAEDDAPFVSDTIN